MKRKSLEDSVEKQVTSQSCQSELARKVKVKRSGKARGAYLKSYSLDLRIHSPAALGYFGIEGLDTAPALLRLAKVKGLDVIAVTDFYSGRSIDKLSAASKDTGIKVIPGVVIRSRLYHCDEVILLCLFPETYSSGQVQVFLSELKIPDEAVGNENFIVKAPFEDVLSILEVNAGIAVPSRMDKTPHRMAAIPPLVEEFGFRAFDIAYSETSKWFKKRWPGHKFSLFSFSNANALAQVGSRKAKLKMPLPGFEGFKEIAARG